MSYVRGKCDECNCANEWSHPCSRCENMVCEQHAHIAREHEGGCTYVCNGCYQLCMEAYKREHQKITTKDQYLSGIQDMINILRALAVYTKEHPDTNEGFLAIAHGMRHEANAIINTLTTEATGE